MYKEKEAFDGDDIVQFLRELLAKIGTKRKLLVFCDNASIHRCE